MIFDVFPSPIYRPDTFEPSYRFLKNDNVSSELISEHEIFNTVYSYIPDLVPYLEFELVFYTGGMLYEQREKHCFNLRKLYYEVCYREELYRHKQYYDNIYYKK